MAAVGLRVELAIDALRTLFPTLDFNAPVIEFYKYAPWKGGQPEFRDELYGLPVIRERTWKEIFSDAPSTEHGESLLDIFHASIRAPKEVDPEEEFTRHYRIQETCTRVDEFVRARGREESQVYGDLPLKHWAALIVVLTKKTGHLSLGVEFMAAFVHRYGDPFHQSTRDLSRVSDEAVSTTIMLMFEMSIAESLQELNIWYRLTEEGLDSTVCVGDQSFTYYELVRELFVLLIPHPKKVCNMLRATYSWYVKSWGTAARELKVLVSTASDDRNAKDVSYEGFRLVQNPFRRLILSSTFHQNALSANLEKVEEAISYASALASLPLRLPVFERLLPDVYSAPFDPTHKPHVILASLMLSVQVMSGYGRAWVKNEGDDQSKLLRPHPTNFVSRLCRGTEELFVRAYHEAREHGFDIIAPEEMYSSLLRLAKNTSSGFATTVQVQKKYGPQAERRSLTIPITSRQKSLFLLREGHRIFSPEMMEARYDTVGSYQTRGSRDVPIKATRTIYAINVNVLAPQHILTLPLNEYFARAGGPTHPATREIGGKVIIGDLEATGSRVVDAADTFRNTGDATVWTLALDYSNYDTHMGQDNFRDGMLRGMRYALRDKSELRYDSWTVEDLIRCGYGPGRVHQTLWNGRRAVLRMDRCQYELLPEADRVPPADAPFLFRPPGTVPIRTLSCVVPAETDDIVLVSPWDGSDLARVTTHLSGENSTLVANSLHNMAMGRIIQEEIARGVPNTIEVLSEMYVGDDTLHYTRLLTADPARVDLAIQRIFRTVELCGHEASAAKTTYLPFSAEKTQTHAKQGIYIPQDRMMIVSSERRKDIEDISGYLRAQCTTFITKVSRGFSEELAHIILLFKSAAVGFRKCKSTIRDASGTYRTRKFDSAEDGYTLCRLRHPMILYSPLDWNGLGVCPYALNVVLTAELHMDLIQLNERYAQHACVNAHLLSHPPLWNENLADKHQIRTSTPMGLYSRITRPVVRAVLSDPIALEATKQIPTLGFGPTELSSTMMHTALLKEKRARMLLSTGYEEAYQRQLTSWKPTCLLRATTGGELSSSFSKIFHTSVERLPPRLAAFPDQNLSPPFYAQKMAIGPRYGPRSRMSYIDRIDSILRADIVMRGVITASTIMRILEKIGADHSPDDLMVVFQLLNLEARVARRLAEYVTADRVRFDAFSLNKHGICGDEFSMSLDVCTDSSRDSHIVTPTELTPTERDACVLHAEQLRMAMAAMTGCNFRITLTARPEHRAAIRSARVRGRLPRQRLIRMAARAIRNASLAVAEAQFV
ncbi:RNA-dependent RNA polymerase [Chenuda virus]|uniref:RNA-directed RNA polymerase n=1 Tax=Chenuda virus TaxID=40065 RepID=A0A0H4M6P3_9REOV|nr:RNA-dependent RNA polymerase [Chenuda virus]AKP24085.1 RNA-dependent RNA polymerase [Chenuda virus]